LKDKNVEIISAAQDSGGEAAAGPVFDGAKASFTALIDTTHLITTLFSLVNVPSGVWIDEQGRIVRMNEGTYAAVHKIGTGTIGTNDYVPAVKDWAENGAKSRYVWSPEQVAQHVRVITPELALADPTFKLGVYFYEQGDDVLANKYWEESQALDPDNWNFHRQDWSFTRIEATEKYLKKRSELGDKPYYTPLELDGAPPADAARERKP
jgi:hypothetical protein